MKQKHSDKIRLIKLLEILYKNSDEELPLTTKEILDQLSVYNIECCRETLHSDIKILNDNGFEIIEIRGKMNKYFLAERKFSIPELRVMIDAIQSSKFITKTKTENLIEKIASLGGSFQAELLKNSNQFTNIAKHSNEHVYYSINEIELAIRQNKKVSFKYFDYDENLKKIFRKNGSKFYINPYCTVINNDNYYLIGYNDLYKKVLKYRIDRMMEVKISHLDIVDNGEKENFNICEYINQLFGMYSGEEKEINIDFDKSLIDVIVDRFGEEIKLTKISNDKYRLKTKVAISPVFLGWCLSFGDKLKISENSNNDNFIIGYLEEMLNFYKN